MKILSLGLAPLVTLVGCTYQDPTFPAEVTLLRSPADASNGVRSVRPASVTAGYVHRVPIEPKGWRERSGVEPDFPTRTAPVVGEPIS